MRLGSSGARAAAVAAGLAFVVLAPVQAHGQIQTGEIFGKVTDSTGAVLPGATVTVQSPALIRPRVVVSSSTGAYRVPQLPSGTYTLRFDLEGFKTLVRQDVRVETGFNAQIDARLDISALQETVTVSGESPVVDTRQVKLGETFTKDMLDHLPSARDPWVILEQTPGLLMDRQNVGGNKSGQQSSFTVHGDNGGNTMWNVDGVTITDMAATGASPTYYDFDSFQEIQIQTGGNDASLETGGINLNMITKSGGNRVRGSGRFFLVDDGLQSDNITAALRADGANSGNPIKDIRDFGAEIGGPLLRNKAWFWGGYGKQDISVGILGFTVPGGDPDNARDLAPDTTILENYNAKLQFQPVAAHKFTFLYTRGDKIRNARGASPTTRIESTFRQSGPTNLYKISHQWIAGSRTTVETQYAYTDGGFVLDFHSPELEEVQPLLDLDTGILSRSNQRSGPFIRPQHEAKVDANYLLSDWLGGDHALKFGVRYRDTPFDSFSKRGGGATARVDGGIADSADLYRDNASRRAMNNISAYVNESFNRGRLRINVGVRVDHQDDEALAASVPANPIVPDLLPALDFPGADSGVTFTNWSPRFGVTYDLRGTGKTIAKGSAAVYYGQGIFTGGTLNPVGTTRVRFPWTDVNGDLFVQREELTLTRILSQSNYNRENPSSVVSPNKVDPNLHNDRTREVIVGLEHEVMQNLGVGASYIYRRYDNFNRTVPIGLTVGDYTPTTRPFPCGNSTCDEPAYTVTYYELPFTIPTAQILTQDPFYRNFNGVELTARKRYAGRWMMNASLAAGSASQHYPGDSTWAGDFDPTSLEFVEGAEDNSRSAKWIAKLSGMYSLPWQINVSGFLQARQGFPFFRSIRTPSRRGSIGRINAKFEKDGASRYDDLLTLDLRAEKWVNFGRVRAALSVDVFNLANANTVLDREGRQSVSSANRVYEILAPRVARFGVRFNF